MSYSGYEGVRERGDGGAVGGGEIFVVTVEERAGLDVRLFEPMAGVVEQPAGIADVEFGNRSRVGAKDRGQKAEDRDQEKGKEVTHGE